MRIHVTARNGTIRSGGENSGGSLARGPLAGAENDGDGTHPLRPKALFASSSLKTLGQQAAGSSSFSPPYDACNEQGRHSRFRSRVFFSLARHCRVNRAFLRDATTNREDLKKKRKIGRKRNDRGSSRIYSTDRDKTANAFDRNERRTMGTQQRRGAPRSLRRRERERERKEDKERERERRRQRRDKLILELRIRVKRGRRRSGRARVQYIARMRDKREDGERMILRHRCQKEPDRRPIAIRRFTSR